MSRYVVLYTGVLLPISVIFTIALAQTPSSLSLDREDALNYLPITLALPDQNSEEIISVPPPSDSETISREGCWNNLQIDRNIYRDIPYFCQSLAPLLRLEQFSLKMDRDGDTCNAQVKWMDIPLSSSNLQECLNLKLEWTSPEREISTNGDSLKATTTSPATLTLSFENFRGETQKMKQDCNPKLSLENLQIVLSDTRDNLEDNQGEEEDDDENNDENAQEELPKFAYCEWSIVDGEGQTVNIDKLAANGLNVEFEGNESDIDCGQNGSTKYDCTHEIDESSHTVTLTITSEGGDEKKSSTCEIPSRQYLLQEQQNLNRRQLRPRPVVPPRPIRFNFGGPILSPGVF